MPISQTPKPSTNLTGTRLSMDYVIAMKHPGMPFQAAPRRPQRRRRRLSTCSPLLIFRVIILLRRLNQVPHHLWT